MNLQHRINLLDRLGNYILSNDEEWKETIQKAEYENGWFIPEFTQYAVNAIAARYLNGSILENWSARYAIADPEEKIKTVGLVLAGNIPLAGFHDILSVFISGHRALIKLSSKDRVLISKMVDVMSRWEPAVEGQLQFSDQLKGCDAYIATGSNNSSRYFEFYFSKYPHIIRKNRTSVAILDGTETLDDLDHLADDIFLYFGLGCRNVTKLYVPRGYDFLPLLASLKKYAYLGEHHKYRNNYDYNLALHLLNKVQYMSSGNLLLVEETSLFSPLSQLNFEYYEDIHGIKESLKGHQMIQCVVGHHGIPFGKAQTPSIDDYADGIDTLHFLTRLTANIQNQ